MHTAPSPKVASVQVEGGEGGQQLTLLMYLVFLNMTMPESRAYRVKSLPRPTPSPGWYCTASGKCEL